MGKKIKESYKNKSKLKNIPSDNVVNKYSIKRTNTYKSRLSILQTEHEQ